MFVADARPSASHDPGAIHATIDYIHANPMRAGLVERPEHWRASSAAYFAGAGRPPLAPDVDSIPSPPKRWGFRVAEVKRQMARRMNGMLTRSAARACHPPVGQP